MPTGQDRPFCQTRNFNKYLCRLCFFATSPGAETGPAPSSDFGRRGYTMAVNAANTAFHLAYWEHLQKWHPRIRMARPKSRGSKSNWVILKGHDFPKGVNMHHKFDQQVIEIGFPRRKIEDLLSAKADWPDDIATIQKGGTASLAIHVPPIDMKLGLAAQLPAIEEVLKAACRLMPYATLLQGPG